MTDEGFRYDPVSDLYYDDTQRVYVRSARNPNAPVFVDVTGAIWKGMDQGFRFYIHWDAAVLRLPEGIVEQARVAALSRLKRNNPRVLNKFRLALEKLGKLSLLLNLSLGENFQDITVAHWYELVPHLNRDGLTFLRVLYRQVQADTGSTVMHSRLKELESYKIGGSNPLAVVRSWDPRLGALTTAEVKVLVDRLRQDNAVWDTRTHALRILIRAILELGKRTSQYLQIEADGLVEVHHEHSTEYLLRIPGVKGQAGRGIRVWGITEELGEDIKAFSARPDVIKLQREFNRLILWDGGKEGALRCKDELSSADVKAGITWYVKLVGVMSPRTGGPLHMTPNRGRHTVGTHLALDGASIDEIAHILEHDHRLSTRAYLDAVGEDLVNKMDKSSRLRVVFTELAGTFFQGVLTAEVTSAPVVVPPLPGIEPFPELPLVVGSCGRQGPCPTHPFLHCYNGCHDFLAWREGDHSRAKAYVEGALEHWTAGQANAERSAMLAQFAATYQGIEDVERRIAEGVE